MQSLRYPISPRALVAILTALLVVLGERSAYASAAAAHACLATAHACPATASARGPLRVLTGNPRYFTDGSGKAVLLVGAHNWLDLQQYDDRRQAPVRFDYGAYLDFLVRHHYNFFRLWTCSLPHGTFLDCRPFPWPRTGPGIASDGKPKFDLSRFDQSYFDLVRSRVVAARERGIYVSVMLFDGFGLQYHRRSTDGFPLDTGNNINGVGGSGTSSQNLAKSQALAVQDAYVRKMIDTVNDLDNVLYEVANEAGAYSTAWQYHIIGVVKDYEASKPFRHPVGMTAQFPDGTDAALAASAADWISPFARLPPDATGHKVVINDTDHSFGPSALRSAGASGQIGWVWENFATGHNLLFMDPYLLPQPGRNAPHNGRLDPYWDPIRDALTDVSEYAAKLDLTDMTPQGHLVSDGGSCLAGPHQYLVFSPAPERLRDRAVAWLLGHRFTLQAADGTYRYEWFDPAIHRVVARGEVTVRGEASFKSPIDGNAVLWLSRE